jgi:hypothetical protein
LAGEAHHSDRTIADARRVLREQRAGGRRLRSIGRGSAELKTRHYTAKLTRIVVAVVGIVLAAMIAGVVIDGIGFTGLFFAALAILAAVAIFGRYPRLKPPPQARLNEGDARTMVARTELWLESQRPALPAPAVELVDQIGVQLDALGLQLEGIGEQPATVEVRKLVGEHLPEMISTYRRIPGHLRHEPRGDGRTPDQQLADGLGKISGEIDQITHQLAAGDLDSLAVRGRFLDYKYGGALEDGRADEEKPA